MGKLSQLTRVANNLADSFVSVTNIEFLHYMESLPEEKTKLFEIDLLRKTIAPKELYANMIKQVIEKYKEWFDSEIKKLNIELSDISEVIIRVAYKKGKTFAKYYTCNVTIKSNGKDYTKKVMSFYS